MEQFSVSSQSKKYEDFLCRLNVLKIDFMNKKRKEKIDKLKNIIGNANN